MERLFSTRWLIVSYAVTATAITVNHLYSLGRIAFALGAALIVAETALLRWFESTRSKRALAAVCLLNAWVVAGFGLVNGLWGYTLPVFIGQLLASASSAFPRPAFGPPALQLSGIAIFIGSLFVLRYTYHLVEETFGMVKRRLRVLAAATAACLAIVAAFVTASRDTWVEPPNGVVKIGIIMPTDGPYAVLGRSFLAAVGLAASDLTGTKYRYELVIRDTGPDPANAAAVIESMIATDKVQAIVGGISLIGQVTQRHAAAARIPHVCVCTVMSIGDGAYSFTNIPSPQAEATLWVQEAQRRGIRSVALLTQDYPSIQNHVNALKAEANRVGLRIASDQVFTDAMLDFRLLIASATSSGADVLYVEALNPALDRLGQQLSDAAVRNIASVVSPSLSERAELFEGVWYTDSNLRDQEFKARLEKQYPDTQFATHMMPYAYDSVNMIVAAFERGQHPAVYLRDIETYEGTAGTLSKARRRGNFTSVPAVWTITDGRPTLIRQ